jgi:4-amino-4-deoxy-L-arabinose transferase-like glycosyltransferase
MIPVVGEFKRFFSARRVWWTLVIVSLLLGMMTRQWLLRNTLINPPSYDALVYHNQSYDDLVLLEAGGWKKYLEKYTAGNWHVPPVYMTLGTGAHLLLGLSSENAYAINAIFFFVFSWSCYLLFRYARAGRLISLLGTFLVAFTPSTVGYALRYYMTDYAAAAAYLCATALLLQTQSLTSRRKTVAYAVGLGFSLLIKSSLILYYLPHGVILAIWLFLRRERRIERWQNFLRLTVIGFLMVGWFYVANIRQILAYYVGWAGSRSVITTSVAGISSTWDGLLYYFRNIAHFHFQGVGGRLIWGLLLVVVLLAVVSRVRTGMAWRSPRSGYLGLILAGQYLVLSAYPSKVFVVDYSLVPFYFLIPVAYFFDQKRLASTPSRIERFLVVAVLLLLAGVAGSRSFNALLRAAPPDERQNWRVRETMEAILGDASRAGYSEVLVGSTPIHPYYTCENLRFYTLNGAFPEWRNSFRMPRIGYAKDAEELYSFVKNSDYVVTVEGWQGPDQAPNNRLAPQVNRWLAAGRGGFQLFLDEPIPNNGRAKVYKRFEHLTVSAVDADGWVEDGLSLVVHSQGKVVRIRLDGKILLPPSLSYPARLYLRDEAGIVVTNSISVPDSSAFSGTFEFLLPPESQGIAKLQLTGDRAFSPRDQSVSNDDRRLLLILKGITLEE